MGTEKRDAGGAVIGTATGAAPVRAGFEQAILDEISRTLAQVPRSEVDGLAAGLRNARAVFVHGAGRSGLVLRMFAMRLTHLGRSSHVVGETTTPAIDASGILVLASASGETTTVVEVAREARAAGAHVAAITATRESSLVRVATTALVIPARSKIDDVNARASFQFAGSLFEQSTLILLDALFAELVRLSGQTPEALLARHANLE